MCARQYGQVKPRLNTKNTIFSSLNSDNSTISPSKVSNLKFGAVLPMIIELLISILSFQVIDFFEENHRSINLV
jgi:hypothetical protein